MPRAKKKTKRKCDKYNSRDEDDLPLTQVAQTHSVDINSYNSLCQSCNVYCEFCEKVSNNRYTSIVHNISHIIIPLINYTVYQCDTCLYYFTSTEDLAQHQYQKHSIINLLDDTDVDNFNTHDDNLESKLNTINIKNENNEITHTKYVKNEIIDTKNVKKEPQLHFQNYIIDNKLTKYENLELEKQKNVGSSSNFEKTGSESSANEGRSLKSRLMFEEDVVISNCDQKLNDMSVECQVKMELKPVCVNYKESIHYEQLLGPGVFKCRKCYNMFPNRYDMILHETKHLVIMNSQVIFCDICNKYILGGKINLKHHILTHNNVISTQNSNLFISRIKNGEDVVQNGGTEQNGESFQNGATWFWRKEDTITKTVKMCSVCYSFCKNTPYFKYYYVDELSEVGKRFKCEKCGYKFFYINLIKMCSRRTWNRKTNSLNTIKKGYNTKSLTNKERLKHIASRFKMMKKIYFVVLFPPLHLITQMHIMYVCSNEHNV